MISLHLNSYPSRIYLFFITAAAAQFYSLIDLTERASWNAVTRLSLLAIALLYMAGCYALLRSQFEEASSEERAAWSLQTSPAMNHIANVLGIIGIVVWLLSMLLLSLHFEPNTTYRNNCVHVLIRNVFKALTTSWSYIGTFSFPILLWVATSLHPSFKEKLRNIYVTLAIVVLVCCVGGLLEAK